MNSPTPGLVSVIVATLNAASTLEQCISRFVAQDYSRKELIVIDGGSTDGTVDIIRRHEREISYSHSEPDRGIADAWNKGVARAQGEWLIFLGADDFFAHPTSLSSITPQLDSAFDVVYGKLLLRGGPYDGTVIGAAFEPARFRRRMTIPNPAAFINRAYFAEVGPFDERYRIALDYEFFLRKPALRAKFCPVEISVMLCGGVSFRNRLRSLQESRDAQIKHAAKSRLAAYVWYLLYRMKALIR